MVSDNVRLSAREVRFIGALVGGASESDAAAVAGVSDRTARRWLVRPAVRQELARCSAAVLGEVSVRLVAVMSEAIDVLRAVMSDPAASAPARTSAARAVLEVGLRLAELVSLSDRVAVLEAHQERERSSGDELLIGGLRGGDI